ncbi:MAG: type II secretion system major pseudopilin GspG [Planctomycetales bacterium]|nr:type II secretion system major pseudopilin GspG [Planctomycetales bacterium]
MSRKYQRKLSSKRRSGFTLLEVMLVLVIIAAIAGIAVVNLGGFQERAMISKTKTEIKVLQNALESYKLELLSYPQQLEALYEKPSGLANDSDWFQVLKEPVKPDAWGNPYEYTVNGSSYELKSLGPDGQAGTDDDIS